MSEFPDVEAAAAEQLREALDVPVHLSPRSDIVYAYGPPALQEGDTIMMRGADGSQVRVTLGEKIPTEGPLEVSFHITQASTERPCEQVGAMPHGEHTYKTHPDDKPDAYVCPGWSR